MSFDLENDLPDELIRTSDSFGLPNGGELGQLSNVIGQDAASKHKQLSELLRAGSGSSLTAGLINVNSNNNPGRSMDNSVQSQQNSSNVSNMGKGSHNQGLTSPSNLGLAASGSSSSTSGSQALNTQAQKHGEPKHHNAAASGLVSASGNLTAQSGIGINNNLSHTHQALLGSNSSQGLMQQSQQGQGQVLNGSLGAAGRGRGGTQYSNSGSVLAETLAQGSAHVGLNAQQAGAMAKVSHF